MPMKSSSSPISTASSCSSISTALLLVHGGQSSALQAALPRVIYPLPAPRQLSRAAARPAARRWRACAIRARPELVLALRIIDVSLGGCALALPDDVPPLPPGARIERRDASSSTPTPASKRSSSCTTSPPSTPTASGARLGCSMVDLPAESAARAAALHRPDAEAAPHDGARLSPHSPHPSTTRATHASRSPETSRHNSSAS